jgi:threonine dehydrogenase-like Zn-dependent dehydrogenase
MDGKMMRASVFEGNGVLTMREIPAPKIEKPDDVLLSVEACSICGTDVHILSVPPAFHADTGIALGHEFSARVVETGKEVRGIKKGDRVIVKPNIYCGTCYYCLNNMNNHCENMVSVGIHIGGGFAEYCKVPERVCYKIAEDLEPELAVFAEPLSCVLGGVSKLNLNPGSSAVIIGGGPIAMLYLLVLKQAGVGPILLSEPNDQRRAMAKELGTDVVINPIAQRLDEEVRKTLPYGADMAIDVVGSQMTAACTCVRRRGTVLLFGLNTNAVSSIPQSMITLNEIRVQGTYVDDATFIPAVRLLESRKLNLTPLITHKLPLEQLPEGVELLRKGQGMEIIVYPK